MRKVVQTTLSNCPISFTYFPRVIHKTTKMISFLYREFLFCVLLVNLAQCAIRINPSDYPNNRSRSYCVESRQEQPQHEFHNLATIFEPVVQTLPKSGCRDQFDLVLQGLRNASLWAVQMLDASAKLPLGLIVGNNYQLGHYDECIQINTEQVKGKYCIIDIKFTPKYEKYPNYYNNYVENEFSLHYDPHKPVWEKFKPTADPSKRRRDILHTGICIPDKCTAADIQFLAFQLNLILSQKTGYDFEATVNPASCSTNNDKAITTGGWIVLYVIVIFFTSVIICTVWDVMRNRKRTDLSRWEETFESFSMHRNIARLSQPDTTYEMNVFHGMKFYSIALIILGHRCVHNYGSPFFNPEFLEERYRKFQDMFLLNGSLIVDTFFVIGGYLTCYALLKESETGRKIKPIQVYLYRWLRITPMYMLVVFFYAFVLEHMGSGPIWGLKVGREATRCRENWWTNLFYINNYINNKTMCMFQSWYVSCDMHYTLIAPFVVMALVKNRNKGLTLLAGIIAFATLVPFLYTYFYEFDGVLRVYMQIFEDLPGNLTFATMYIKSHHRAVPYFIGMAAAYLFTVLQNNNFKFSKWMVWTGSLISTVLSVWAIWGAWHFYIPGRKYDAMENAVYSAVHRLAWGVAMAWIPVAGGRRAFGIIQPILAKQALAPLSRLSFGAFLVHGAVQLYFVGSMRIPEYIFFPKLFWMTAGDLLFSFLIAFLLHIIFEAPVQGILKLIFSPKKTGNRKQNGGNNTPTPTEGSHHIKSQ